MLYGNEIWAETLDVKKWASSLVSVQKTTAYHVVLVIAATIPGSRADGYL